jgi:hypothetical protein
MRALIPPLLLAAGCLQGQTLDLYSEFLRIGPSGAPVGVDRTAAPREILSPGVVRGGYASFQVVVRAERGNYFLFLGQNPPGLIRATLQRLEFVKGREEWIPDRLAPERRKPIFGVIPDPEAAIPGQSARVYLLDLYIPPTTPSRRTRLEVQMKTGSWTVAPMELRILPVQAPAARRSRAPVPELDRPAADAALAPLSAWLAGKAAGQARGAPHAPETLREVIRRNVEQDLAIATPGMIPLVREKMKTNPSRGGEWYLAIRDLIYREAGGRE